jgi:hypothetical protein
MGVFLKGYRRFWGVVPAVGGPIWDNWPVDVYASNKSSLTVLSVLFGTKLDFNFESS